MKKLSKMTREELYIARLQFKTKVLLSDKQSYEDIFINVMENSNSNFQPVKTQGSYGDRKNDGFDKLAGVFYQVYAPEDLTKVIKKAEDKLIEDFNGLKDYWANEGFVIKEFYYVVHDKYKGTYPTILTEINKIAKENNIIADIFRNKHLEDQFLKLDSNRMTDIISWFPSPLEIQEPSFDVMSEVINYLLNLEAKVIPEQIPESPNFEKKLFFNGIGKSISSYFNTGRIQHHTVKEYFELNSNFVRDELRETFSTLYREAVSIIPEGETKTDQVYIYNRKINS